MLTNEQILARWDSFDTELKEQFGKAAKSMEEIRGRVTEVEQHLAQRRSAGGGGSPESWGKSMVDSAEFKALARSGRGTARIEVKSTITSGGTSGGPLVPTDQRVDPILMPRRRLGIRDLLSQGQTTSNGIRYVAMTGRDVTGGVQTEGQPKREGALTFESRTANVATIAVWIPASKQILSDAPALQATIDAELRYGVAFAEEAQILSGDGTGENLRGLVPSATVFNAPFVVEAKQRMDTILLAQTQLEAADFEATGVVLNPIDWARIRTLKDGEERYLAGGPLTGAPRQLWDLPVVTSNSFEEGEFLVGDFKRAGLVLDREEVTVEISTEHEDFFTRNLVAIRAEKRVALLVTQPGALISGDFSTAT